MLNTYVYTVATISQLHKSAKLVAMPVYSSYISHISCEKKLIISTPLIQIIRKFALRTLKYKF